MNLLNLNIANLSTGNNRMSINASLSDLEIENNQEVKEPVQIDLKLNKIGEKIFINAHLQAQVGFTCDRCLDSFTDRIVETIDFIITSSSNFKGVDDENVILIKKETSEVNIAPLLREILLLAVPMKHLCRENCKGLCPICGENLNQTTCNCKITTTDSRLEVLQKLLNQK